MSRRDPVEVPDVVSVEHICRPPRWMARAILAMAVTLLAVLVGLGVAAVYVYQANQYVQGRGEYRDREAEALERLMRELDREAACDLLDTLPEGAWFLDRPRGKYQCGPGIPIADLSPQERSQLSGGARAGVIPPPPVDAQPPTSPLGAPPTANPPRRPASEPPPRTAQPSEPAPEPSPEPGPLVDLEPACGLIGICPREAP